MPQDRTLTALLAAMEPAVRSAYDAYRKVHPEEQLGEWASLTDAEKGKWFDAVRTALRADKEQSFATLESWNHDARVWKAVELRAASGDSKAHSAPAVLISKIVSDLIAKGAIKAENEGQEVKGGWRVVASLHLAVPRPEAKGGGN